MFDKSRFFVSKAYDDLIILVITGSAEKCRAISFKIPKMGRHESGIAKAFGRRQWPFLRGLAVKGIEDFDEFFPTGFKLGFVSSEREEIGL